MPVDRSAVGFLTLDLLRFKKLDKYLQCPTVLLSHAVVSWVTKNRCRVFFADMFFLRFSEPLSKFFFFLLILSVHCAL